MSTFGLRVWEKGHNSGSMSSFRTRLRSSCPAKSAKQSFVASPGHDGGSEAVDGRDIYCRDIY